MGQYSICTNFVEIVAGTNNKIKASYTEAANAISNDNMKSMAYLKNFITSIENLASKKETKDKAISDSKGNIKDYSEYDNIQTIMNFIKKNLNELKPTKDVVSLYDSLIKYQPQYTEGYQKNVRLIMLEYESVVYMLVTGIIEIMSNKMDFVQTGTKIEIKKRSAETHGTINEIISQLATELQKSGHKDYLEALLKAVDAKPIDTNVEMQKDETKDTKKDDKEIKESVMLESVVSDSLALVSAIMSNANKVVRLGMTGLRTVKNSMFGIVPLIRSILYMKYKKKADRIEALDQQVAYLQNNIDQLKNRKDNMDPAKKQEIIKKQQAAVEAYKKRAEKLRAELMEEEKEASTAIKQEDPQIKNTGGDDGDFVLEGVKISEVFAESDDSEGEEDNDPAEPDDGEETE